MKRRRGLSQFKKDLLVGILFLYRASKTEFRIESNKLDEPFPNFIVNQENYITQTCPRPTLSFANFRDAVRMIVQCSVFSVPLLWSNQQLARSGRACGFMKPD